MTAQDIFNLVWHHYIILGSPKSVDGCRGPMYRAYGNMCPVGVVIDDTEYDPAMEGNGVRELVAMQLLPAHLVPHVDLLWSLQRCHDMNKREDMEAAFRLTAEQLQLQIPG